MEKRWLAVAIIQAEERMHRVRGYMGISSLIKNMEKMSENEKKVDRWES